MKRTILLATTVLLFILAAPLRTLLAQEAAAPAAPAAAAPAVAGAAASPQIQMDEGHAKKHGSSLWEIIFRAGWFGLLIWILLLACLIMCVTLVVDSYLTIREKNIAPMEVVEKVRTAMQEGDLLKAINHCEHNPGPLASILKAGFNNVEEGFEVIQDAVSVAADIESEKLLSRVTYLSVISNTTPMLGLIGTVQGMIMAFGTLGTTEAGAAQQSMLALNISHGLWATAVGLTTAVPATIYFFFFKNRASKIILGMEALTLDVIKSLRNVEVVDE
jgi:biopolymer transport protein ExbB